MVIETDMQAVQASGHWPHITSEHLEGGLGDFHLVVILVVSVIVVALQGAQVHLMSSIIILSKALGIPNGFPAKIIWCSTAQARYRGMAIERKHFINLALISSLQKS